LGLLVVGSLGLDTVETPFDKVKDALGGSATYISLAASYFGGPVELVGVVGSKRAVIYGSTMASFCVEKFSTKSLEDLSYLQIQDRYREFMMLSRFDEQE